MKKVLFILGVVLLISSCTSSTPEAEAPKTDSLPTVDTSVVVPDTTSTDTITVK